MENDPGLNEKKKDFFNGLKKELEAPDFNLEKYKNYLQSYREKLPFSRKSRAWQFFLDVDALITSSFISLKDRIIKNIDRTIKNSKKEENNYWTAFEELKSQIKSPGGITYDFLLNFKHESITYSDLREASGENSPISKCIKNLELELAKFSDPTTRVESLVKFNKKMLAEAAYQQELLDAALKTKLEDILFTPTGVAIMHVPVEDKKSNENKLSKKNPYSHSPITECRIAFGNYKKFQTAIPEVYKKIFLSVTHDSIQLQLFQKRNELNPLYDEVIKFIQRIFLTLSKDGKPVPDHIQKKVLKRLDLLIWNTYNDILIDCCRNSNQFLSELQINPKNFESNAC